MLTNKKLALRLVSLLTVLIMAATATPVLAVSYDDLKAAENKAAASREKINKGNAQINQLNQDIKNADLQLNATQEELTKLESQLSETRAERDKITAKLNELRAELARNQQELDKAMRELKRLTGQLNKRAGNVYKTGEMSFLEVLLDANSFGDFIHRARFLQTIISVDARLVKSIKETKGKIEQARNKIKKDETQVARDEATLTQEVNRVASLTGAVQAKKNELQGQIVSKKNVIGQIKDEQVEWQAEAIASENSADRIRSLLSQASAASPTLVSGSPSASGFIWPVAGPITAPFGEQRAGYKHTGIDIGVPSGTPVAATKAGKVIIASWYGGYGNLVVIDHGGGVSSWYGHNSSFTAGVGQTVSRGQVIAKSGSTGHSTGPHVHFEIRFNGNPINPRTYLP